VDEADYNARISNHDCSSNLLITRDKSSFRCLSIRRFQAFSQLSAFVASCADHNNLTTVSPQISPNMRLFLVFSIGWCLPISSSVAVDTRPRHCGGSIRHVHLTVGPEPSTSMIVNFASIPSKFDAPMAGVLIGTSPSHLNDLYLETSDSPTSYNLTVKHGANFDKSMYYSPHYHHISLTDLQPSTTYYYLPLMRATLKGFGDSFNVRTASTLSKAQARESLDYLYHNDQNEADLAEYGHRQLQRWGPYDGSQKQCPAQDKVRSFQTAPAPGSVGATIAVVGDIGQFPHSEETMARLLRSRNDLDIMLLVGDLAYTGYDHRRWDTFMDFFDDYPLNERVPLQICPGNHDIDKLEGDDNLFLAYEYRFRMPRAHPPQLGRFDGPPKVLNMDQPPYPLPYEFGNAYYAFSYGGAHIISLSNYAAMEPTSTQYKWLEDELILANANREETPWILIMMHVPIYNTFGLHRKDPQIFAAKEHLEPLFVNYTVNVVLTGHIHAYQRTTYVQFDKPTPKSPMHITVGAGGRQCQAPFLSSVQEDWIAVRDATMYGYGMLRIHNATTAEWDWIHTGHNDDNRDYNEIKGSDEHLPSGPAGDHVYIENIYLL
jgi:acid phosphatase type 7